MAKSLNDILAELGYTTEPVPNTYNKRIIKDGELVGTMSSGQVRNYLRHDHPEYFEKEGNE
ncbi:MAG: hypothetical protein PWQ06_133 [Anaerophaga sp.]|nr:hypothetical protein [Anaerophaga sp.]